MKALWPELLERAHIRDVDVGRDGNEREFRGRRRHGRSDDEVIVSMCARGDERRQDENGQLSAHDWDLLLVNQLGR